MKISTSWNYNCDKVQSKGDREREKERDIYIWIPEIEYYQKVSSHAQIWPKGAEKQLIKIRVVVVVGVEGKHQV